MQIDEELPGVVAHLRGDVVQPPGTQGIDRRRREPEPFEGATDEMGDALTLGGQSIVLIG